VPTKSIVPRPTSAASSTVRPKSRLPFQIVAPVSTSLRDEVTRSLDQRPTVEGARSGLDSNHAIPTSPANASREKRMYHFDDSSKLFGNEGLSTSKTLNTRIGSRVMSR